MICKEKQDIENAVYFFQEASNIFGEIEDHEGRDKASKAVDSIKRYG